MGLLIVCSYMATSGLDRRLKVWDMRMRQALHCYKLPAGAGRLSFSQRGLLACTIGNVVEVGVHLALKFYSVLLMSMLLSVASK